MPRELELKLLVRPARLARLQQALSAISAPQRQLLETHYFDCDDGRGGYLLRSLAAALRVRVIGDKRVQTLKTAGAIHAGMLSRGEWETEVTGDAPDLAQLETDFPADAALAALIAALRDKPPPRHIFTTRFERDAYSVTTQTGVVEAALDSGEVVAGERAARICELELELVRGEPVAIFDLAVTLSRTTPFSIGLVSKAERGYALLGRSRLPPPAKAQRPALLPAMTVEDAFAAILLAGLSQLIANLDGFLHRRDPEYLHQMRVATRRIRAALSLFARALPRASLAGAARATASYGRLLGEARNWDVLVSELLPQMAQVLPSETGLLRNQVRQQARGARAAARRALRDRRYTQFLLGFAALVVGRRWRDAASESALEALAQPAGDFARRALRQRDRKLRSQAAEIHGADAGARHAARIAAKKLRYCAEFFSSLLRDKECVAYVAALSELQDALGRGNDLATANGLFTVLREQMAVAAERGAAIACLGWIDSAAAANLHQIGKAWRKFERLAVPRIRKRRAAVTSGA